MALTAGEVRKSVRQSYKNAGGTEVLVVSGWYGTSGINLNVEFTAPSTYSPSSNKTEIENTIKSFLGTMNSSLSGDTFPRILSS